MNNDLLNILPVKHENIIVSKRQKVNDIIKEVLKSHVVFESDYLKICDYFYNDSNEKIFHNLFNFCKQNLEYEVEPEENQTLKSPGLILRTKNDCKHYASFIAGNLNAINMKYGKKINWRYRFGSYSLFNSLPSHVFVVVRNAGKDVWLDPVLKSYNDRSIKPVFIQDKKLKNQNMLSRISGVTNDNFVTAIKYLAYKGVINDKGLNREKYIQVLEAATPQDKENLKNSYVIVKQGTERGTVGSFWDVVGNVFKTLGNVVSPPPPPPPPPPVQSQNSFSQYLPIILIAGVGVFAFIEFNKK